MDLTNSGLCALDDKDLTGPAAAASVMHADANTGFPSSDTPAPHVDDCFCCSRCVEPGQAIIPAVEQLVSPEVHIVTDRLPLPDRASIYHPPQFLG